MQRTSYDNRTKLASKIHTPLTFPLTLYVDRYLESNKHITLLRRENAQKLKEKSKLLNAQLLAYRKWKGKQIGLDEILAGVIDYLQEQKGLEHAQDTIALLSHVNNQVQQTIKELEEEIKNLENEVRCKDRNVNRLLGEKHIR